MCPYIMRRIPIRKAMYERTMLKYRHTMKHHHIVIIAVAKRFLERFPHMQRVKCSNPCYDKTDLCHFVKRGRFSSSAKLCATSVHVSVPREKY